MLFCYIICHGLGAKNMFRGNGEKWGNGWLPIPTKLTVFTQLSICSDRCQARDFRGLSIAHTHPGSWRATPTTTNVLKPHPNVFFF